MQTRFVLSNNGPVLDPTLYQQRVALFMGPKMTIYKTCTPSKGCDPKIEVDIESFLDMLRGFADAEDASGVPLYNGMRVHFAAFPDETGGGGPVGKEGFLTLFFVPTVGQAGAKVGDDDPEQCYYIDPVSHKMQLDANQTKAKPWIAHFRNNKVSVLTADGAKYTGSTGFKETYSLFYTMLSISGDDFNDGMIQIFQDNMDADSALDIRFNCFIQKEAGNDFKNSFYQLTVAFHLFPADGIIGEEQNEVVVGSGIYFGGPEKETETDTGIPCPPNGNCPPPKA